MVKDLVVTFEFYKARTSNSIVTNKPSPSEYHYLLNDRTIKRVPFAKYLGLTISQNLSCFTHIPEIIGRANSTLAFLGESLDSMHKMYNPNTIKHIHAPFSSIQQSFSPLTHNLTYNKWRWYKGKPLDL